jgi:hypothetical protein
MVFVEEDGCAGAGEAKQVGQQSPVVTLVEVAVAKYERVGEYRDDP